MNPALLTTLLALATLLSASSAEDSERLNTVQMIESHGYPCENHEITTEDGYILTFQRIPHGKNDDGSGKKPPVLLMHGLLSSSADYVSMGPNISLTFLLADIGYDVWIGNARGNAWSRNHTTLDITTDGEQFFDFSWHEIGYYDLPAAIDYILETNGDDSLYYVGHSQGCTSFLVLGATRPEYNSKIKIASLMGPAAFMKHQNNLILDVLSKYIYDIEKLLLKYKIFEVPFPEVLQTVVWTVCTDPKNFEFCNAVIGFVDGEDPDELPKDKLSSILSNIPSNAGVKQVLHYGQLIKNDGVFRQYDHGTEKNQKLYGSDTPPEYDLSIITAPVAVYYGKNDGLVKQMDAKIVIESLPNVANDYLVDYEKFNHIDFVVAKDVVEMVYVDLIKTMQKY